MDSVRISDLKILAAAVARNKRGCFANLRLGAGNPPRHLGGYTISLKCVGQPQLQYFDAKTGGWVRRCEVARRDPEASGFRPELGIPLWDP
jgi:hypothetical protein